MESLVRLTTFLGVFIALALWEYYCPRRLLVRPRRERWLVNLSLTVLNTVLVRLTVGGVAFAAAVFAAEQGIGVFHWLTLPTWTAVVFTLLSLDLAIYLQHVMFHALPVLWRLHRVHHADLDFDATTGLRFHPLEIVLSLGFKVALVVLLGALPCAVVAFEVLLNASSVFNHGNVALPEYIDRWLRRVVVTPDMHRVHHSTYTSETNANFGFAISWWDHLCGTYRAQPELGHVRMDIGLSDYRSPLNLGQLLLLPFRRNTGHAPSIGSRSTSL